MQQYLITIDKLLIRTATDSEAIEYFDSFWQHYASLAIDEIVAAISLLRLAHD